MELNFKLAVHCDGLGEYTTEAELIQKIEELVEVTVESSLATKVAANVALDELLHRHFSCVYDKGDKEIIIPFMTQLRGKDEIGKHMDEFGYAPDKYVLRDVYAITEDRYYRYCQNRHADDPLKATLGKNMKYYKFLDEKGELLSYIGSRRTFKSDTAIVAYAKEQGKLAENIHATVEFDIEQDEYFLWKFGVKSNKKNSHYVVYEEYTDGRVREYIATLATKLAFTEDAQVKTHMMELGKIGENTITGNVKLEKCALSIYKEGKTFMEGVAERKDSSSTGLSESDAETKEYNEREDDFDF